MSWRDKVGRQGRELELEGRVEVKLAQSERVSMTAVQGGIQD